MMGDFRKHALVKVELMFRILSVSLTSISLRRNEEGREGES